VLRRWETGLLAVAWLAFALLVFVVAPLRLDEEALACQENYGRVEWTGRPRPTTRPALA
jgi:hypothetical protein